MSPFPVIIAFIIAILFSALLANPWFALVAAVVSAGIFSARYAYNRHGKTMVGATRWQASMTAAIIAGLYAAALYIPMGFVGGWYWKLCEVEIGSGIMVLSWAMLFAHALSPKHFRPGPVFPWAPSMALSAVAMRWSFAFVEYVRLTPAAAFVGPVPVWAPVVIVFLKFLTAATIGAVLIVGFLGMKTMRDKNIFWWLMPADNCAFAFADENSLGGFIISTTEPPVPFPTPNNIVREALAEDNLELITNYQLSFAIGAPAEDARNWTLEDWRAHYTDNPLGWIGAHLDVTAYGTFTQWCIPKGFFLSFLGSGPFDHCEIGGLEVRHETPQGVHVYPAYFIDLREVPPQQAVSVELEIEGIPMTVTATYKITPRLLPIVVECKGRNAKVKDRVQGALGRILRVVGPWLWTSSAVGDPIAFGGATPGVVLGEPARLATPITRRTSMLRPPARREDMPTLIEANRPAFLAVFGIIVDLHVTVLQETGMWITPHSFELDDVDVAPEFKAIVRLANQAVIMASASQELLGVEMIGMMAKMAGLAAALREYVPDQAKRDEIIAGAAPTLALGGAETTDALMRATALRLGIDFAKDNKKSGGGDKK